MQEPILVSPDEYICNNLEHIREYAQRLRVLNKLRKDQHRTFITIENICEQALLNGDRARRERCLSEISEKLSEFSCSEVRETSNEVCDTVSWMLVWCQKGQNAEEELQKAKISIMNRSEEMRKRYFS